MGSQGHKFAYSDQEIASLELTLSSDRLRSYLIHSQGDMVAAIHLYEHNCDLSEALYGVLQGLEVALRNSIHTTLSANLGNVAWYDHIALLRQELEALQKAKSKLTFYRRPHTPGRVISELSFGFWTALCSRPYSQSLWIPHLHKAFPHKRLGHRVAYARLEAIRKLRNRVAHHEPILNRDLEQDYRDIIETVSWICPTTALWLRHTASFEERYEKCFGKVISI
jgi:hypothetical protein